MSNHLEKFNTSIKNTVYLNLPQNEQIFIKEKSLELKFTLNEIKQIVEISRDLSMWGEKSIIEIFVI